MSRETPPALAEGPRAQDEREALTARLTSLERANEELRQRVWRYERERAEIKLRLERILSRIGCSGRP
jgi:predicted nuclease with TOPRIM domain